MKYINKLESINFSYRSIDQIVKLTISAFVLFFLLKYISVENFAKFNLLVSILGIFLMIGMIGSKPVLFNKLAKDINFDSFLFSHLLVINVILFFASLLFVFTLYDLPLSYLIIFFSIFFNPFNIVRYKFDFLLESKRYLIYDFFIKIFFAGLRIWVLIFYQSIEYLLCTILVEYLITSIFLYKISDLKFLLSKVSLSSLINLFKLVGKPFFISIITLLFLKVDLVFVSKMTNEINFGYYSLSSRFCDVLLTFSLIFFNNLQPRFNNLYQKMDGSHLSLRNKLIKNIIFFLPPLLLLAYFCIKFFVDYFFPQFHNFSSYFFFHIILIFFITLLLVFNTIHHATQKYDFYLKRIIFMFILNFPFNYFFISLVGPLGAILATLFCIILALMMEVYFSNPSSFIKGNNK